MFLIFQKEGAILVVSKQGFKIEENDLCKRCFINVFFFKCCLGTLNSNIFYLNGLAREAGFHGIYSEVLKFWMTLSKT